MCDCRWEKDYQKELEKERVEMVREQAFAEGMREREVELERQRASLRDSSTQFNRQDFESDADD